MTKLETVEGIGPVYASQLRAAGIATVEALLAAGATPGGRQELEQTRSRSYGTVSRRTSTRVWSRPTRPRNWCAGCPL
jgi:hypothetical protein